MSKKKKVWPGITLLLLCMLILSVFSVRLKAADDIPGVEISLNPEGQAHEVYRDAMGRIWISDYFAGEIWEVDPEANTYTVYSGLDGASNGIVDPNNILWYSDFDGGGIGRLILGQTVATVWPLPEGSTPLGLTIDEGNRLWVTDVFDSELFRIDIDINQLCRYIVPGNGTADYLIYQDNELWMGDTVAGRIVRLRTATNQFTVWPLEQGAYPQGLALDQLGSLWWADPRSGYLGQLDPSENVVTKYAVPLPQSEPQMVAYDRGRIWYTDLLGRIGYLEPNSAQGSTSSSVGSSSMVRPSCESLGQGVSKPVDVLSGTANWEQTSYTIAQENGGWGVFELPVGSRPWGLVIENGHVWFADQGNGTQRSQSLGYFTYGSVDDESFESYIPLVSRP